MSDPYIGEIRMGGWNFAPAGWAFCDGSLLSINDNSALFELIGTTYGGDGQNTFALPNLLSRIPMHNGGAYTLAAYGGTENETLTVNQIPAHIHTLVAQSAAGQQTSPANSVWAGSSLQQFSSVAPSTQMAPALQSAGGNQPHSNLSPFLAITFVIALFGVFPSQS